MLDVTIPPPAAPPPPVPDVEYGANTRSVGLSEKPAFAALQVTVVPLTLIAGLDPTLENEPWLTVSVKNPPT